MVRVAPFLAIFALLALAAPTFAIPGCPISGAYDLGPGDDGNQATGTGPFHVTATNTTFSYVDFVPNQTFTFDQLDSLFAIFTSNSGGSGGGTPRLSVLLDDNGTPRVMHIYLGNSPAFTDTDAVLNTWSGANLIGNNDAGRYDTSHFSGGSPSTTYANAVALVGSKTVLEIDFVADTFSPFPSRDETLTSIGGTLTSCGPPTDAYQVAYLSNLITGDSYLNLTNAGTRNGFDPDGGICANVYVFDPSEEMVACCSCYVSPDGLRALSAQQDLVSKTLTPGHPNGVVVKLLASQPNGTTCDPTTPSSVDGLESGLRAWATTLHVNTTASQSQMTENAFLAAVLSPSEQQKLTTFCAFIKANGSTFGLCQSCTTGGSLGGVSR